MVYRLKVPKHSDKIRKVKCYSYISFIGISGCANKEPFPDGLFSQKIFTSVKGWIFPIFQFENKLIYHKVNFL